MESQIGLGGLEVSMGDVWYRISPPKADTFDKTLKAIMGRGPTQKEMLEYCIIPNHPMAETSGANF